jgi:hypothetical protein
MTQRRQLLAAIAGLLLPLAALIAYAPPWQLEVDGWENTYLNTYPANFAFTPKHLIIGTGCWTWTPEAYMPIGSDVAVNTQRATLQSALNTVMDGAGPDRFYGFGKPGVDFERQLISIYDAVRRERQEHHLHQQSRLASGVHHAGDDHRRAAGAGRHREGIS